MRIDVITLLPDDVMAMTAAGVTGRAIREGVVELHCWNPRDYAADRHNTVDDRPYGGGPGMVMTVEPTRSAIRAVRAELGQACTISMLSPQGRVLDQAGVNEVARRDNLVLLCGRYEGIDERLIELEVDEEWSIGDYVLSGGELAAAVIVDAVTRFQPGVLGDGDSAQQDSFVNGLLDHPHYSRPERLDDLEVPKVLLSGDHGAIASWRRKQALGRTWQRRPDLLEQTELDKNDRQLLEEYIRETENE